jgi:hypothetical protein
VYTRARRQTRGLKVPAALEGGLENAAVDLILPEPAPRWLPPSDSPGGHGPIPPDCLITLRNAGHKMNLF